MYPKWPCQMIDDVVMLIVKIMADDVGRDPLPHD